MGYDDENIPEKYSIFRGEVFSVKSFGAFISMPGCKKQGLVHISQISRERVENPEDVLSRGDRIFCKLISIDENGKIGLSMKMVNQTTGEDQDPNQVQLSLEEQRKKSGVKRKFDPIEIGAVYNTVCKKCGTKGHIALECYQNKNKSYQLVQSDDEHNSEDKERHHKKKKKSKKLKKEKKSKKKRKHDDSDTDSDSLGGHKKVQKINHKLIDRSSELHISDNESDSTDKHKKKKKKKHKTAHKSSDYETSDIDSDSLDVHKRRKKKKHKNAAKSSDSDSSEPKHKKKKKKDL